MSKKVHRPTRSPAILVVAEGSYTENGVKTFSAKQISAQNVLIVDERYQRNKIEEKANEISAALQAGGVIPDDIWVSKRHDGTYAIIDGLQRYWGAYDAGKSLRARVYMMNAEPGEEWKIERQIFHVLNSRKAIGAGHRVLKWPNAGGEVVRSLARTGSLRNRVVPKSGRKGTIGASTLARSLACAMTGSHVSGSITKVMSILDRHCLDAPKRTQKMAQHYGYIVGEIFNGNAVPSLAARAFGIQCHKQWSRLTVKAKWPVPTKSSFSKMKRFNWRDVTPGQESKFIYFVLDEVEKRWPVA